MSYFSIFKPTSISFPNIIILHIIFNHPPGQYHLLIIKGSPILHNNVHPILRGIEIINKRVFVLIIRRMPEYTWLLPDMPPVPVAVCPYIWFIRSSHRVLNTSHNTPLDITNLPEFSQKTPGT